MWGDVGGPGGLHPGNLRRENQLSTTMALTALTVLIGAAIVVGLGREKRGIHFGSDL